MILRLLVARRFLPLFVTQGLGAMVDNLFKNALAVLALFTFAQSGPVLVAAAGGVFILPYVLFSSAAGQLAEGLEKSRLIRLTKAWEVLLMLLASAGFWLGNFYLLMLVLFGLGVQATFFSPLKYGILPVHLAGDELLAGNGLVEAGTFVGILAGTILGGALILGADGRAIVSGLGLVLSVTGLAASFAIPLAPASAPGLRVGWNLPAETVRLVRLGHARADVWLCITGIGWFWAIGALVLAEFPVIAKDVLGGGPDVVTLLLTMFSIGVGVGSVACARLLHGRVSARLAPWAAVGISIFALDFAFAVTAEGAAGRMADAAAVLGSAQGWRMLGDLLLLAACGGAYSVPLYAVMQVRARPEELSRMIGCNNVMNAVYMVVAAVIAGGLAAASVSSPRILQVMAAANLLFAAWLYRRLKARGL